MNGKLWSDEVIHTSPDGERTFRDGTTDETRRAAQRDARHAAEVKVGQGVQPVVITDADEPTVVSAE